MTRQALDRTTRHLAELRKAQNMEEAPSIQLDFLKESMKHAYNTQIEMLATFPHELMQP